MVQIICIILFLSFSNLIVLPTSFLPDMAGRKITIISNPFARSLPANPTFGLMSHAPHSPRWGASRGPFIYTGQQTPTIGGYYTRGWGWGVPLVLRETTNWPKLKSQNIMSESSSECFFLKLVHNFFWWFQSKTENMDGSESHNWGVTGLFHHPGGLPPTVQGLILSYFSPV